MSSNDHLTDPTKAEHDPTQSDRPLRSIKSFVVRRRRFNDHQWQTFQTLKSRYGLDNDRALAIETAFGNRHPLIIEIGFGMGDSLIEDADRHPNTNYLGIEVHEPGIALALKKIAQLKLANLLLVQTDAKYYLEHHVADQTVSRLQIYFPDPWPKKRHQKRRLLNQAFLELAQTKLKKNGFIHFATDMVDYAQAVQKLCQRLDFPIKRVTTDRPKTKYEQRGEKLGHQIFDYYIYRQDNGVC